MSTIRPLTSAVVSEGDSRKPCGGTNVNICVGEGCYGESCLNLRGNNDPKPVKPEGDDPRSGTIMIGKGTRRMKQIAGDNATQIQISGHISKSNDFPVHNLERFFGNILAVSALAIVILAVLVLVVLSL